MIRSVMVGVLALLAAGAGETAKAADLDAFYGQPQDADVPPPNYTFGSGWYLRGDVTATDDLAHHSLGTLASDRKDDWTIGGGGGAGYQFTSYLRADLTGDYFGKERVSFFNGDTVYGTSLHRYDVLGNAYFDLGTWAGFTPYIGAGVGFAGLDTDATPVSRHDTRFNLAWAAMAGVAYHVTPNLLIDVGYRYLNLGDYGSPLGGRTATLDSHQVRAGLRYMIY